MDYYPGDAGLSILWIILIVILVVVLAGTLTGSQSSSSGVKLEDTLEKDVDKIFSTLTTQAQKFNRPETVQVLADAKSQVIKVLRERKLI
ncbi:MAG: hypothetical protein NW215_10265 [Hyphomicrobiales bacterium]|nr:hypothetical protein [Hyphomicrobiales bacterium]